MTKALAYLRTSSATNVGGDTDKRQRAAIEAYAASQGIELVGEFYDADVSGADELTDRPGYRRMLERIAGNGVRLVIVEDASRFARSIRVQEVGLYDMQKLGVRIVTASGIDLTDDTDPERIMIRQMLGVLAEGEKRRLVAKLKGARDRNAAERGYRTDRRPAGAGHYEGVYNAIRNMLADDPTMTLQAVADALTTMGMTAMVGKKGDKRPGKPFHTVQIHQFIKNLGIERVDGRTRQAKAA